MSNFHQLKDNRNKCAYKGINIIEEEDCFWVEIEIFEKKIFVINLVSTILDKSPWDTKNWIYTNLLSVNMVQKCAN